MNKVKNMKNNRGFTIIEFVASFSLMMIVIVYLIRTIVVISNKNQELLTLQEYEVLESTLLNEVNDDIKNFKGNVEIIDKNESIFISGIDEYITFNREDNCIIYKDTIYELPEGVKIGNTPYTISNIKDGNLMSSNTSFYVAKINLLINGKEKKIVISNQYYDDTVESATCYYETGKTWNFEYTGDEQSFNTICPGVYKVELWGAQGGTGATSGTTYYGGKGSYTSGEIYLNKDTNLNIYVGGKGENHGWNTSALSTGGWNGGGAGGDDQSSSSDSDSGGSGGGSTDVSIIYEDMNYDSTSKIYSRSLKSYASRIMVAAGGGGGNWNTVNPGEGSNGGGLKIQGYNIYHGTDAYAATDGTQTSGYNFGIGLSGSLMQYGDARGGGGGGYWTGNTERFGGQGVGGTSYISGHTGSVAVLENSSIPRTGTDNQECTTGTTDRLCSIHYSNYEFINTKMIDGSGHEWTNERQDAIVGQPTINGTTTQTGNEGNGYARITYMGENYTGESTDTSCSYTKGQIFSFEYTGDEQSFTVPCSGNYKIETWGAQGGNASTSASGGKGAYASGYINLSETDSLYINVGGKGNSSSKSNTGVLTITEGGYNGGGSSANQPSCCSERYWGSGGGATDIRLVSGAWNDFNSLKSRLMVAAGGGGAYTSINGGAAGGINGLRPTSDNGYGPGSGATQTEGGKIYNWTNEYIEGQSADGGFGYGGFNIVRNGSSSGGGAGYYGGGGSYHIDASGGGSSFISGYSGCDAISELSTNDNIIHTGQANHYSNYIFTKSVIKSGNEEMPTHDGTNVMTGNSGNGYARITYIGSE